MGTAIQSERAAPRRDPAGRTLTGRPDPTPLEALPKPDVTDPGDETSMPLIAPQPTPATRSNLGLRKLIGLPGWRWRKQGTSERAEADLEARRAAEELVAMRAQLEDAEAQRVQLEQDLAGRVDTVRREANTAHAARIAALETQAADRIAVTRRDAGAALVAQRTELEAQAAAQVAAAVRAAQEEAVQMLVETMKQHELALASARAEAQADAARAEDRLAELKQQSADREKAQMAAREEAVRAAAETAQQHEAALTAVRAKVEDADARRVQLERDIDIRVDGLRRDADTAYSAKVEALETEAAGQLAVIRRDAETALAAQKTQLVAQAAAQIEAAVREARHEAVCAAAEIAQQHEATLTAVRAQLEDTEARRAQLERDLVVRVDIVRRKESTAHAARQLSLQPRQARRTGDRPGGGGG